MRGDTKDTLKSIWVGLKAIGSFLSGLAVLGCLAIIICKFLAGEVIFPIKAGEILLGSMVTLLGLGFLYAIGLVALLVGDSIRSGRP